MSIWVFIWLILSVMLLYFFGWTLYITYQQKRAWKAFAEKNKLRYEGGKFSESPKMEGIIDGYAISLFTGEHLLNDERQRLRKMTAIEIRLDTQLPVDAGVASGDMVNFVKALEFKHEIKPEYKDWKDDAYIAATDSRAVLKGYLTQERLNALTKLMKIKNVWVILVFRSDTALLRIDTSKALEVPKLLNSLVQTMVKTAKVMELQEGEAASLKRAQSQQIEKEPVLEIKQDDIDDIGLELEDDNE